MQSKIDRALELHHSGRFKDAILIYEQLLRSQTGNPYLLFLIGSAFGQISCYDESIKHLKESIRISPNPVSYNNLGVAYVNLKMHEEAAKCFIEAIALNPQYAEGHCNLGSSQREAGLLKDSLYSFDEAIRLFPNYRDAYLNKGKALFDLKEFSLSLECFTIASKLDPTSGESFSHIGKALLRLGRYDDAIESYQKSVVLNPNDADAYMDFGGALKKMKRLDEALTCYEKAIKLKPANPQAYNNRGNVLKDLKRFDDALASYEKAIELKLDYAEAYNNRGNAFKDMQRLEEALADYEKAASFKPDYVEANWNKSLALLLAGRYLEGWEQYEWRLKKQDSLDSYEYYILGKTAWRGQANISGKKILILSEQGFGDVIQFSRYLPHLKSLGAEVFFEVPEQLISLVATVDCDISVIAKGTQQIEFDACCPIMSLPYVFKTTVNTIPAKIPYLHVSKAKKEQWQYKLPASNRLKVGLVWSGNETHQNDFKRTIKFEKLLPLFGLPIEWHSLVKEYRLNDLDLLKAHPEVRQHQHALKDFSDTAALIECLDLVISVDTSVAHVAGALGKPVWILLPYVPDYRWMLDREDSPWYSTAKLFRQPELDDWESVIKSVRDNLIQLIQTGGC